MNEKKALIKWLNSYQWNVFGTLNFKYQMNEIAAENALKYFNYGSAFQSCGCRLDQSNIDDS